MIEEIKAGSGWGGIFVGAGLVVAACVLGTSYLWAGAQAGRVLEVTGTATEMVKADTATWHADFSRSATVTNLKDGYAQMKNDEALVSKFFKDNKVASEELQIMPVSMFVNYNKSQNNDAPVEYNLTQTITVQTKDLAKVDQLAKSFQSLINQGVIFSAQPVEYYYSGLSDLKVKLIGDAVKDAKARAQKVAEAGDRNVGELRSAASGVVQVLAPNSTDVSDYGTYDTRTIDKQVMVTVRTKWGVR
ncbi:MAG: SIMPL domain-containing protein [Candidatus Magasanikbacteria bacterium]|nr:SIMPL domain-containing protein [Candidatus Magasanikbacteria bacterium]